MIKYNYFVLYIYNVSLLSGVILRNIALALIFVYFIFPLAAEKKTAYLVYGGYLLFTLFFLANFFYSSYFGNYLSISDIIGGGNTGRFSLIEIWINNLLETGGYLFLLDLVILPFLIYKDEEKKEKYSLKKVFTSRSYSRLVPLIIIIVLLVGQIFITNSFLGGHSPGKLYQKGTKNFVNVYGILPLYAAEIYDRTYPKKFNKKEDKPELMGGQLKGKGLIDEKTNIIVIQCESIDAKLIDFTYNEREVTPFLNQLKKEGLYFNNFYAQHVNGSFNADFSFLTSLYPESRKYTYRDLDLTEFDSLISVLNDKGYETQAYHGYDPTFFNRKQAFSELGFDDFYGRPEYSREESVMEVERTLMGINDYDFFKQSLALLEKTEEPFFSLFITVTSHKPFDYYPSAEKIEEFSDIENKYVRDYFNSIAFLDQALEMFYKELENRGMLEDTLLVLYSDHESGIDEELYSSARDFELESNVKQPEHIPLLVLHPELEAKTVEKTGTPTDLAPTILDLLGEKEIPAEFAGNSLFSNQQHPVLFLNDIPQVLYKNQLFLKDNGDFKQVGHVGESELQDIDFSSEEKQELIELIQYIKNDIYTRLRK
ncbi:MAG: LTA synthase family protein [Bacillota bacterium]